MAISSSPCLKSTYPLHPPGSDHPKIGTKRVAVLKAADMRGPTLPMWSVEEDESMMDV